MEDERPEEATNVVMLGKRKVRLRVCVADGKEHTRKFLAEILEELGFIPCECSHVGELDTVLGAQVPDLVVIKLSAGGIEACEILKALAAKAFGGKVLLLGPRISRVVAAVQELGEGLGIAMLPTLDTPFGEGDLRDSVATLLPTGPAPPGRRGARRLARTMVSAGDRDPHIRTEPRRGTYSYPTSGLGGRPACILHTGRW